MTHPPLFPAALACALTLAVLDAQAARPMITDNARVVDARACQVESWTLLTPRFLP